MEYYELDRFPYMQNWLRAKVRALSLPVMQGGLQSVAPLFIGKAAARFKSALFNRSIDSICIAGYAVEGFVREIEGFASAITIACDVPFIRDMLRQRLNYPVANDIAEIRPVDWVVIVDTLDIKHSARATELQWVLGNAMEKAAIGVAVMHDNFSADWLQNELQAKFPRVESHGPLLIARQVSLKDKLGLGKIC